MENMTIGVVGLGRMGLAIAQRLQRAGMTVHGFDMDPSKAEAARAQQIIWAGSLQDLAASVRIMWVMVPAGVPTTETLLTLAGCVRPDDIVIDGGNSYYEDSQHHAQLFISKRAHFLDCGVSGGLHGGQQGYALMVGGKRSVYTRIEHILKALAAPGGYALVGTAGAGHYVKMVHNGIEYALLQAYGEGFHLLKDGPYEELDLAQIAGVWNNGSIIRSWICKLSHDVLMRDQEFVHVSGKIGENGTGNWTVETAEEFGIPLRVIEEALDARAVSRATGGNYATKLVALLRREFGGHAIARSKPEEETL